MASRSWNRIELMGNLTRDPELRFTPNGVAVCSFGVATNRTYVVDGEKKEEVDFHRLVAWNKLAELCNQLLKKGTRVFISGRLTYHEWETQEGQKRKDSEIVVEDMIVLTPKSDSYGEEGIEGLGSRSAVNRPAPSKPAEIAATPAVVVAAEAVKVEVPVVDNKPQDKPTEDVAEDLPF